MIYVSAETQKNVRKLFKVKYSFVNLSTWKKDPFLASFSTAARLSAAAWFAHQRNQ
jgi:hypothetical protein